MSDKYFWFFTVFLGDLEGGLIQPSPLTQATSRRPTLFVLKVYGPNLETEAPPWQICKEEFVAHKTP